MGRGLEQAPAAPQQKPRAGRDGMGGAGPTRTHLRLLKVAASGILVSQPSQEAIVPTCTEMETAPAGQEAR